MDAEEHVRIRKKIGLSQRELGGLLGCGQTAIAQREQGLRPIPEVVGLLMQYMGRYGEPETALIETDGQ